MNFLSDNFLLVLEEKKGLYDNKEKISFECGEDGHFYDSNNKALVPEDIECHHLEICHGQNITEAMDGFIDQNKLLCEVKKVLYYPTSSNSKHSTEFRIECYIGGQVLHIHIWNGPKPTSFSKLWTQIFLFHIKTGLLHSSLSLFANAQYN